MKPFLKWVGGKSQLLGQMTPFFPTNMERYLEPFVGGGAIYLHVQERYPGTAGVLRDINPELINCYQVVRDCPEALMEELDGHETRYLAGPADDYYHKVRSQHELTDMVQRAARMIFLNKTCFNGLWRVNAAGRFNVPRGSYQKVTLYDRGNLMEVSRALRGADIAVGGFEETLAGALKGDFVYLDPPYHPVSRTSSFASYAKGGFGEAEQVHLAKLFADTAHRGVRLMLSNSDTEFTRRLYSEFRIETLMARRAVNSRGSGRGSISEILVLTY